MIRAYDEILCDRAFPSLGWMLDFAVHSLHYKAEDFMDLFAASGTAALFEHGDIRMIAGMSGIELAYEVLERSGAEYERTSPRHSIRMSSEYWCGYTLASVQWQTGSSFDELTYHISIAELLAEYEVKRADFLESLPWNMEENERIDSLNEFGRAFASEALDEFKRRTSHGSGKDSSPGTPLKIMRIKNGLSQSQLAKASGVPVRTIQQYEQRQKDLSKARSEYLIMLSSALNCSPALLLERDYSSVEEPSSEFSL